MPTEVTEVLSHLSFETVFDDERYIVRDAPFGSVTVSVTKLHPEQATRGHAHAHPELLTVNSGSGILELGPADATNEIQERVHEWASLMPGNFLVIPGGAFHRVVTASGVEFTNIFEGERTH